MLRGLLLSLLSATFVYGATVAFAPPAWAVNCDVNACISTCQKRCPGPACACPQNCMQTIDQRKKTKQCK
jgi:hypothetical protein